MQKSATAAPPCPSTTTHERRHGVREEKRRREEQNRLRVTKRMWPQSEQDPVYWGRKWRNKKRKWILTFCIFYFYRKQQNKLENRTKLKEKPFKINSHHRRWHWNCTNKQTNKTNINININRNAFFLKVYMWRFICISISIMDSFCWWIPYLNRVWASDSRRITWALLFLNPLEVNASQCCILLIVR